MRARFARAGIERYALQEFGGGGMGLYRRKGPAAKTPRWSSIGGDELAIARPGWGFCQLATGDEGGKNKTRFQKAAPVVLDERRQVA
jgi:hypothetical protein